MGVYVFVGLWLLVGFGVGVLVGDFLADSEPDDDDLIRALRQELAFARREALSAECANEVLRSRLAAAMGEGGR